MTVNGIEKECVLEFIEKHQKSEAHFVKEWNKCNDGMATELDEKHKGWLEGRQQVARRGMVKEQEVIKEFALLLGLHVKNVSIRVKKDPNDNFVGQLLEVRSLEVT